ncbi:hypothetical protein JCGZ_09506 [Jatropha curcas]|uniref:Uncharacterized protein n=1 Tax=Jatropha curcas TaxID=180498 RepID=A0A067KK28_JATCU|nr:hypothetical protein JCGZ_09506 [Jatropha curcas]
MARGRAFDSDAFDSGPRGGHCQGHSTRGRGGTNPPPSSSGTYGASSSAQPLMPPSLPSIPSSSTPLPRPVESSPASQSPTAPTSSEPRNKLSLVTGQMQKSGKKQQCVSQEIWESWQKAWEDPAFKRKCDIFAQNRCNETGGDGAGPSRHTGRSISAIETSRLLAKKYGREPTPMEVFTYTLTKDHDGNTFVDRLVLGVNPDHSVEEISVLRARVDEQDRQLTELRAHVMRMSGQHGAGTSSSDPSPATDRDVLLSVVQMARGRAFDSDAFDSGPRGGHCQGHSTRGRGGTNPPPSSSGTYGASSSAQPLMPPSLPSIPSSSTPLPRPVESSPASQSPTAPTSRQIMRIMKLHFDKDGYKWDAVPQEARDFYWEEFQEKLCALRYADFTYRMQKSGKKQQCVSQEIWESWQKAWEDPAFKRKCDIFAQNRCNETGGDGAGPSRHTGRSISAIETSRLLAKKYGREPTPMEVFTYTLTKDHDGNTFVDRLVLGVNPDHSVEEISVLRARVDEQDRQLTELRAHVMRMSGQHGAGTSSSDPSPATDRDVSIALHQPLPSPLDPDT